MPPHARQTIKNPYGRKCFSILDKKQLLTCCADGIVVVNRQTRWIERRDEATKQLVPWISHKVFFRTSSGTVLCNNKRYPTPSEIFSWRQLTRGHCNLGRQYSGLHFYFDRFFDHNIIQYDEKPKPNNAARRYY